MEKNSVTVEAVEAAVGTVEAADQGLADQGLAVEEAHQGGFQKISAAEYEKILAKKRLDWAKQNGVDLTKGCSREDAFRLANRAAAETRWMLRYGFEDKPENAEEEIQAIEAGLDFQKLFLRLERKQKAENYWITDAYEFYLYMQRLESFGLFTHEEIEVEGCQDEYLCSIGGEGEPILVTYE